MTTNYGNVNVGDIRTSRNLEEPPAAGGCRTTCTIKNEVDVVCEVQNPNPTSLCSTLCDIVTRLKNHHLPLMGDGSRHHPTEKRCANQ